MSDKLDSMIKHLQETHCSDTSQIVSAEFLNEINKIMGCDLNATKNQENPSANSGSHFVLVSAYQSLLLLRRIEELERKLKEVDND